jgi:glyoxylate/hydroxypyruvate reductase A
MGTGSIGSAIARRARVFGMTPLGFSRSGAVHDDFARVYGTAELPPFLSGLDVLVAVLPDTPGTAGLLDETALRALPDHAQLINVGRGSLIPEADLLRVLSTGHLAEVVLDVFQTEPLPPDHAFWAAPRLQLTAHVAARSWPRDIAKIFLENLERYVQGQALRYQLVPERGY